MKCLIFYLSHRLILEKVHRIVSFKQEAFLKEYMLYLSLTILCAPLRSAQRIARDVLVLQIG